MRSKSPEEKRGLRGRTEPGWRQPEAWTSASLKQCQTCLRRDQAAQDPGDRKANGRVEETLWGHPRTVWGWQHTAQIRVRVCNRNTWFLGEAGNLSPNQRTEWGDSTYTGYLNLWAQDFLGGNWIWRRQAAMVGLGAVCPVHWCFGNGTGNGMGPSRGGAWWGSAGFCRALSLALA